MNKATVISSIKAIAGKTLPAGSTLLLYGSRARGDNRPDSDWDLLILLDKPSLSFRDYDYGYPFSELGWETGEEINAQVYSKQEKSVRVSGKNQRKPHWMLGKDKQFKPLTYVCSLCFSRS